MSIFTQCIFLRVISVLIVTMQLLYAADAGALTQSQVIYRWTDELGHVHFGDSQGMRLKNPDISRHCQNADLSSDSHGCEALFLQTNIIKSIPANDIINRKNSTEKEGIRWKRKLVPASAETKKIQRCDRAESQLREVRAIMRNGYKPSQYNRLHQRELQAFQKRGEHCQK